MAKRSKTQSAKNPVPQADAVQMLKADHKQFKIIFEQHRSASAREKTALAGRLFTELDIHTKLEEEIFYPAVRTKLEPGESFNATGRGDGLDATDVSEEGDDEMPDLEEVEMMDDDDEDEELIATAYDEHETVKELIQQLKSLDPEGSDYQVLFTELEDAVIEHISGEEEVILPIAAAQLDIQTLGIQMQRRRDDLSSSLAA
ncbi:MAG TPA: hemerythrin domain-containing protein [Nitrospiraceae bacterium]|jgi:hypothetical protein